MKNIIIGKIGEHQTIEFAVAELRKYLLQMDGSLVVDVFSYDKYDADRTDLLWVGMDSCFDSKLPNVKDRKFDDGILVEVKDFAGIITGTNERSVLMAVYKFLRKLGCAFVRPGRYGDVIPEKTLEECNVKLCETPSYRNRSICIEGACSYQNVYDIIDWMPKVGFNIYWMQFFVPYDFFKRWYDHTFSEQFKPVPFSMEEASRIHKEINKEEKKRSLCQEEIGHGWTCVSFGLNAGGWSTISDDEVPEAMRPYLAMINGERKLFGGCPLNTQLCYSSKHVRDLMVDSIINYCKSHPDVAYLSLSLADEKNNFCECEECSKMRPADWLVTLLNELDERMTNEGLTQKVLFSAYVNLLYAPKQVKIKNQDRFIMEFAPITRSYAESFMDIDPEKDFEPYPYEGNKTKFTADVSKNLQLFKEWLEVCPDVDTIDFDYHLWTDHYYDFGFFNVSRIMHDDIVALDKFKLNGMVSCQNQRCYLQNNLPMTTLAETLWNKNLSFEEIAEKHFFETFGKEYEKAKYFCEKMSELVSTPIIRFDRDFIIEDKEAKKKDILTALSIIEDFEKTIQVAIKTNTNESQIKSWEYMKYNTEMVRIYIDILLSFIADDKNGIDVNRERLIQYYKDNENNLYPAFDIWRAIRAMQFRFDEKHKINVKLF